MSAGEQAATKDKPKITDPVEGVSNGKFAMWLFLVSDAMGFIGLLAAYVAIRWTFPETLSYPYGETWDPLAWFGVLGMSLATFNTFVLIVSSVTMVQAMVGFMDGDLARGRRFLLITVAGGMLFLGIQAYEWSHMIAHVVGGWAVQAPSYNLQAACFYGMTGFHGCHVLGGVILLLMTYVWGGQGYDRWNDPNTIEVVGLYWHFVDLVWILIFTFVYLI